MSDRIPGTANNAVNKTTDTATGALNKTTGTATGGVGKASNAATGMSTPLPMHMDFSVAQSDVLQWLPSWLTRRWKEADQAHPSQGVADHKQGKSTKRQAAKRRR